MKALRIAGLVVALVALAPFFAVGFVAGVLWGATSDGFRAADDMNFEMAERTRKRQQAWRLKVSPGVKDDVQ